MATMTGVVTIVQESRFQLTDGEGVSHLFVLSPLASTETGQLRPLMHRQAKVQVKYKEGKKIIGLLAQSVDLCEA